MKLTGRQWRQLSSALISAFPTPGGLERFFRWSFDLGLWTITSQAGSLSENVHDLIVWSEAEGVTAKLVYEARRTNPGNADLAQAVVALGYGPAPRADTASLEAWVNPNAKFRDVRTWTLRLLELDGQVCRVELPDGTCGSGFLVGPDVVLTNRHVVSRCIKDPPEAAAIVCRFDFFRVSATKTLPGVESAVAAGPDWLLHAAEHDPVDVLPEPKPADPAVDRLDFAFMRLSREIGREPRHPQAVGPTAGERGWIRRPVEPRVPVAGTPLFILQHPSADPVQLATDQALGLNANGTRFRYRVNTLPGSSGSPVFTSDWELVALHHAGDPAAHGFGQGQWNAGIPIGLILRALANVGQYDLWRP